MAKVWVVRLTNGGEDFWLRSTVWTYRDRATEFATEAEARASWDRVKKFTKASLRRQAVIEEVDAHVA